MKKINALIVDDEIAAINTLRGMLSEFCPMVNITGAVSSVEEAVTAVQNHKPDLVFLDIEMHPSGTGFDLLKITGRDQFEVIFTTAYPQYAIQAINTTQPLAYLVKPYSVSSLIEAVHTAFTKLNRPAVAQQIVDGQGIIILDQRKGYLALRFHEILYCQSDGPTLDIFINRKGKTEKITTYRPLKEMERELPENRFCRTHNSYVVNLEHIERYERSGRSGIVYLDNGSSIPISIQKMDAFEQQFTEFIRG